MWLLASPFPVARNSSEIKVSIDFPSNFVQWTFIIWELQFWNRGCSSSSRSTEALKTSHFGIIWCLLEERILSNNKKIFVTETNENTTLFPGPFHKNYSQYIVLDTNKDLSLILTEAKSSIKIWTKFLDVVTKQQNRKDHSVSTIFLIYSIFSNGNQISLFSHKAYDKFIIMTGKKVGCSCSLVSNNHFSTDRTQYQGKSAMFLCAHVWGCTKWWHKLCAERMRDANVRNQSQLIIVGSLAVGAFDLINCSLTVVGLVPIFHQQQFFSELSSPGRSHNTN